ncbi:S-adenosyl-L-methionine-dependent methyltransferase [Scleroderma yunnanense]
MSVSSLWRGFSSTAKSCSKVANARKVPRKSAPRSLRPSTLSNSSAECGSIVIPTRSNRRQPKLTYVSENKFHLPADHEWSLAFPTSGAFNNRVLLRNHESAARVAEAFVPAGCRDKVIVEAFPGPGVLTRALMDLPKERIRKIIVLEHLEPYLDFLRPLQEADPRVEVLPLDGFSWNSYQELESRGSLNDVETVPWDKTHPHMHFIAHLPTSVYGEQLLAQFLRLIPDGGWLFQYGRVPMSYVMHDWLWERASATTESYNRCKLSVIAQAVASFGEPLSPDALLPYDKHFWPSGMLSGDNRFKVTPMTAVTMNPLEERIIEKGMLDKWDYCLRKLFVLKSTNLKRAISHLAPGSSILLSYLTNPSLPADHPTRTDVQKLVRQMEVTDWAAVVRAFDAWPFAPEDLLITEPFSHER